MKGKSIPRICVLIFIIIFTMIFIVMGTNLLITGNIAGVRRSLKIGLIDSSNYFDIDYSFLNQITRKGLERASGEIFSPYSINIIEKADLNMSSVVSNFTDEGIKIVFVVNGIDVKKLMNVRNDIVIFSPSGSFAFSETGNNTFFFRDIFMTPSLVLSDYCTNELGLKNIGVVYMSINTSRYKGVDENFDNSTEMVEGIIKKKGNVSFFYDYKPDNAARKQTLLSIINNTNRLDGIIFIGYGATESEFIPLIKDIRNTRENLTICSIFIGTAENYNGYTRIPNEIEGIYFVAEHGKRFVSDIYLSYSYTAMEIIKNVLGTCKEDNLTCIKEELHRKIFDMPSGRMRFTRKGILIAPYYIYLVDNGMGVNKKGYTLNDIDNIINSYNLSIE